MTNPLRASLLSALLLLAACESAPDGGGGAPAAKAEGAKSADASAVAARVGGDVITVGEIDAQIQSELARLEAERYEARKEKLDEIVDGRLLTAKAKELGMSARDYLKREIEDKIVEPSDEKVRETYERVGKQAGTFEAVEARIRQALRNQAVTARRAELSAELRKEAKVEVALQPPRIDLDLSTGVAAGPENAPITLVEFSDYQCPFCARSQAAVDQVLKTYEGKVRHVYMDFPLAQIHPLAMPASVASRCAGEQGKYWEYHRLLFERQKEISEAKLAEWGKELGLDAAKFEECRGSKKFDEAIKKSIVEGRKAGISGTPGFFVNGVPIKGAQPFEVFRARIEDELSRG